jgi:hypothetical protein
LLDVETLTLANVMGRLKATEDELEVSSASINHVGKLYLSEEAWEEKWKLREGSGGGSGSSSHSSGANRVRGNGGDDRDSSGSSPPGPVKVGRDQCHKCGKKGHWARDCWSKPKEMTYTTQEESLMLLTASPQVKVKLQSGMVQAVAVTAQEDGAAGVAAHVVHLREERLFAHLEEKEEHDCKSWIYDMGATNHMLGSRTAFVELDMAVRGIDRFGDDSMTEIEGRGTVEFLCKNGERRSFAGVYFIPRLTANTVSVGQLDEVGYDIHIKVGKQSRLYVLDVNIAWRAACLSVRAEAEARRWHA